ncbi:MAG: glycerophosphodiester phosphodiesterase [Blastocatellia bacterium]
MPDRPALLSKQVKLFFKGAWRVCAAESDYLSGRPKRLPARVGLLQLSGWQRMPVMRHSNTRLRRTALFVRTTIRLRIASAFTVVVIGLILPIVCAATPPLATTRPSAARARATLNGSRTLIIAHRGGANEAPENTLLAFRRALRLGVDGIETDVRLTRDGKLVLYHDARPGRVESGRRDTTCDLSELLEVFQSEPQVVGDRQALVETTLALVQNLVGDTSTPLVSDLTYSELLAKRNACVEKDFGGPAVLTLGDLFGQVPSGLIDLDIKPCKQLDELITEIIGVLRGVCDLDRVIVEPPDLASAQRLRAALGPRLKLQIKMLGLDFTGDSAAALERALALKPHSLSVPYSMVTGQLVERAHRMGVQVWAWTVDAQPAAHQMERLGVDAIKTDSPSALIKRHSASR